MSDHRRVDEVRERIWTLPKEQQRRALQRLSYSYSGEQSALAQGARIEGDEMVWPDGERYPRQTEPSPSLDTTYMAVKYSVVPFQSPEPHPCSWYVNPFLLDGDGRCGVVEDTVLVPFRRKSDGTQESVWQCPEHRGLENGLWTCLLPDDEMSPSALAFRRLKALPKDRREAATVRFLVSRHLEDSAVMMGARIEGEEVVWPNGERYPRGTRPV